MLREGMFLLVLIFLQYHSSSGILDITNTCMTLCVETNSVDVFQQCQCKTSEGDITLVGKVVVEFTKWPADDKTCEEIGRGIGGCLVRYSCGAERRCLLKNCTSQKIDNFKHSMCHGGPVTSNVGVRMTCVMCTEIHASSTHIQTCNNINDNVVCTYISHNMTCLLTTNPIAIKQTAAEIMMYMDILQSRQTRMKAGDIIVTKNKRGICERIKKVHQAGKCPLGVCDAVKKGNYEFIKELLLRKTEIVNCRTCAKRNTPIIHAVRYSQLKMFDLLLGLGADVTVQNGFGENVIHVACRKTRTDRIVRTLVELGMDVEKKGYCNKTPLLTAARYGDIGVVKYLVDIGANVNSIGCDKYTILHYVCANGHGDITMLDYILKMDLKDITLEGITTKGYTPLHIAVHYNKLSILKFLCERGCNLETKLFNGNTVLHTAAEFASFEMVKFIVSKNVVELDSKNNKNCTALQNAIRFNRLSIFRLLYGRGCNLENKTPDGNNGLHIAAEFSSLEMVKFIISQNVLKINSLNNLDETPLMTAKRRSRVKDKLKIINLLQQTNMVSI